MPTWQQFEQEAAAMAATGRRLLYQFGIGLGYLATVRRDGGPRVHPICPVQIEGRLWGLIGPSPKQGDLLRDGRFALHSFPCPDVDDEFYLTGAALRCDDATQAERVRAAFRSTGGTSSGDEILFEFDLARALLATYKARGEPNNFPPRYDKWHATPLRPAIRELTGGNMDIDLIPNAGLAWTPQACPWNEAEQGQAHKCAVKDIAICRYFRGIRPPDTVLCAYSGT